MSMGPESIGTLQPDRIPQQALHLLIVDDVMADVELIALALETAGVIFTYDTADKPLTCQQLLQAHTYDALLSDYRLPNLNGLQTLKLLQASGQNIPFILITGTLGEEAAVECIKAGMTDYVLKERLFRLPSILARALQEFDVRRQKQRAIAQLESAAWREAAINRIVQTMRKTLVLDEVLQTTTDRLHEFLQVNRCLILQPNAHTQVIVSYVSTPTIERQNLIGSSCPFAEHYYQILKTGSAVVIDRIEPNVPSALKNLANKYRVKSLMIAPLVYQEYLGAISIHQCDREREWTADELALVTAIAEQCAIAIHQAKLYQQTQTELLERQRMEAALRQAEAKYRGIFENAVEGIYQLTPDGRFLSANPALARIYGYESPAQLIAQTANLWTRLYVNPHRLPELIAALEERGEVSRFESQIYRADGSAIWISENARAVRDESGRLLYYEGSVEDITEHKQTESLLIGQKKLLELLVSDASLTQVLDVLCNMVEAHSEGLVCAIFLAEKNSLSLRCTANPNRLAIYEQQETAVLELSASHDGPTTLTTLSFTQTDINYQPEIPIQMIQLYPRDLASGNQVYACWSTSIISESGKVLGNFTMYDRQHRQPSARECRVMEIATRLAGIAIERKQVEAQLRYDAFHDSLTGLYNRAWFIKQLQQGLQRFTLQPDYKFAVLFLDLDNFKIINDSLGHLVGDKLLVEIANRLYDCLHLTDTIARLGGDEFAILIENKPTLNQVCLLAEQLQQSLKIPLKIDNIEIFTTVSIGIALSATGYEQPEDILRDADIALYRAKQRGKGCFVIFDRTMHQQAIVRLQLETALRQAIQVNEAIEPKQLLLHYQPIISLSTGRIVGFEALVRWHHPERGLISPAQFIPIAEETGLIIPLGWWVLHAACYQLYLWQTQFPTHPALTMSVNLSGKQFAQPNLVEQLNQILLDTGCNPQNLKLEITESTLMEGGESAVKMLEQLQKLGIDLCIDDFGTGYSSLSRLHQLPINTLKIDRTFVMRMGGNSENSEIVRSIISLGHNLGMDIVAEGVELSEQFLALKELGCEYGQGYLFAKPMEAEAAANLIIASPQW